MEKSQGSQDPTQATLPPGQGDRKGNETDEDDTDDEEDDKEKEKDKEKEGKEPDDDKDKSQEDAFTLSAHELKRMRRLKMKETEKKEAEAKDAEDKKVKEKEKNKEPERNKKICKYFIRALLLLVVISYGSLCSGHWHFHSGFKGCSTVPGVYITNRSSSFLLFVGCIFQVISSSTFNTFSNIAACS
jgi:hypothetical protein